MEMAWIVFRQTLVMFLYMLAGFALFKSGKLTARGSKDIASLLLWLIIPAVLINSFCVDFSSEKLWEFLQSALLGALSLAVAIVIARLIFRKAPIDDFAAADQIFTTLMGDKVPPRRKFIEENAEYATLDV